jgi:primosomal protein N' (replication factor Y)
VIALVTALSDRAPEGMAIKPVTRVLDKTPYYDAAAMKFLHWVGEYYLAPPGLVLRTAWPEAARHIYKRERAEPPPFLEPAPGSLEAPRTLNPAQDRAMRTISAALDARRFEAFLLHGITGSGKTEVYLRAAGLVLEAGRSTIVLVPEISLAIQIVAWFRARFGDRVVVLHSRLTGADRGKALDEARRGPRIIVGARSAVFAPVTSLGLIVVDEEHEPAYKQEETVPLYHARDCALQRGKLSSCPVVLGSATPSLEAAAQAKAGRMTLLELPDRVDGTPLPLVELVPMKGVPSTQALSAPLARALEETVARGEQALLFLNRRGFAPVLLCTSCGHVPRCARCSTNLVLHAAEGRLLCHWCNTAVAVPRQCPTCAGGALRAIGLGTERVESAVRDLLPEARLVRMDQDTTRRREAHGELLELFASSDILIGTQMIAKGLDFPRLTLVGVILADASLDMPDFRAAERTFQLLTQVAGRAGRRAVRGRVIIQTYSPDHPVIRAAADHDYWEMYGAESALRKSLGYPPFGRIIRLRLAAATSSLADEGAKRLTECLCKRLPAKAVLLGPAPCTPAVVAKRHRRHLVLRGQNMAALREAAHAALAEFARWPAAAKVRLHIDPDPLNVMS